MTKATAIAKGHTEAVVLAEEAVPAEAVEKVTEVPDGMKMPRKPNHK